MDTIIDKAIYLACEFHNNFYMLVKEILILQEG